MSSQKGNIKRSRPQKYQNQFAFKNNLHDTSHKTKVINGLQIANVCERCKKIIEWKIKYKKYKPLKAPAKCNKCDEKTVKHAYHSMCGPCARERDVCPKCCQANELVPVAPTKEEQLKLDAEMQNMLKSLPERKRRTFMRYMNKQAGETKKKNKKESGDLENDNKSDTTENNKDISEESRERTREDIMNEIKSLMIDKDLDDYDFGSDFSCGDDDDDNEDDDSDLE